MATDGSHRIIMGKIVLPLSFGCFSSDPLYLYLQVMRTYRKSRTSSNFGQIRSPIADLAALEHLKKSPSTYNGQNAVSTLAHSLIFFILAGSTDMYKSLDEVEFRAYQTTDCKVL